MQSNLLSSHKLIFLYLEEHSIKDYVIAIIELISQSNGLNSWTFYPFDIFQTFTVPS